MKKAALIIVMWFILGTLAWAQSDDMRQLIELAQKGSAEAQSDLGYMYFNGEGVARDYAKGLEWYKKAAAQNYVYAQYNLGIIYDTGEGVKQDLVTAFGWYRQAAENGLPHAQHNVATMYQLGEGINRDYEKALYWYEKAAERGYSLSQYNLSRMYYEGLGTAVDLPRAYAWASLALLNGDEGAGALLDEVTGEMSLEQVETGKTLLRQWLDDEHASF